MHKSFNALRAIKNPEVDAVFKSYPEKIRAKLMFLRQLILETAARWDMV